MPFVAELSLSHKVSGNTMVRSIDASRHIFVHLGVFFCIHHVVHGFMALKSPCFHARTWGAPKSLCLPLPSTSDGDEVTINPIVASVKVSKTVEVFGLVKQMEAEGETVTSLCVGEPDFPPPKVVLEAAMAAISGGATRYTAVTGTAELRNAIANDLKRRKGLEYNPQTEIVVGNGVSSAVRYGTLAGFRVVERA